MILDRMANLMAGDSDDRRAAGIMAQTESFLRASLSALRELSDSGYDLEAQAILDWLTDQLEEL